MELERRSKGTSMRGIETESRRESRRNRGSPGGIWKVGLRVVDEENLVDLIRAFELHILQKIVGLVKPLRLGYLACPFPNTNLI